MDQTSPSNTTPNPDDQYNSDQNRSDRNDSDLNREKPATGVQDNQDSAQKKMPRTASGIPLSGLIGAVSMFGFAIRRWL